ncbi:hypothetical protein WA026_018442 [Henosepilachna vigintioctopunctata]|uniref:Ionotropic receptor n=1 Tax=Henosepilachna vigintioctopunctata TaxID=420089 RepID=A0AAW1V3L8_9CUCU
MKISSLLFNVTLTRCINFIVNKYTSPSDFIILTSDRTDVDAPVARIDFRKRKITDIESKSKPTFFIVENMNDSDIFSYWATVTRFPRMFFHPRARYLFIEEDFSPFYLRLPSRFNVFNSIFLNAKTGNIYTSFPFMNTNRKLRRNNAVHRIGKCDETSLLHDNLYPSKLPKDWQNQAMRIIYMSSDIYTSCVNCTRPGIEIEIITLILNHLKIFYHFYESKYNYENELLIQHSGYDFFIGTALSENTNLLEYTRSYVDDYMSWFVPMPKKLERWRYILLVFSPTTWILGHPFLPVLDRKLQHLIEFGITDKIIEKYDVPPWELPTLEPIQSLKMEHMVAPFIILGVGILMSLLAFCFEMRQFISFNPKVWFS